MASDFLSRDRLKPFLLDRLTDESAGRPARRRGAMEGAVSPEQYRQSVLRDLRWLLNTIAPPVAGGTGEYEHVATSVLNFGLPDVTALTRDHITGGRLERQVRRLIERYEPRILPRTLSVRLVESSSAIGVVELLIEGDLWSLPAPEALRLTTTLDTHSGTWEVRDR